jgi:hypothetical protein
MDYISCHALLIKHDYDTDKNTVYRNGSIHNLTEELNKEIFDNPFVKLHEYHSLDSNYWLNVSYGYHLMKHKNKPYKVYGVFKHTKTGSLFNNPWKMEKKFYWDIIKVNEKRKIHNSIGTLFNHYYGFDKCMKELINGEIEDDK